MIQICLIFQVHQPFRLRNFHFFEIGGRYPYFDEEKNAKIIRQVAENSYLPTNRLLQDLIKSYGTKIKIGLAISGCALDQMEAYFPEVLESFQQLVATGNVELLGQTYSGSLSSVKDASLFADEVSDHKKRLFTLFRKRPKTFFNTGLVYSDKIGKLIADQGFKAAVIEGATPIFEGRNLNRIYESTTAPPLKLLLRNTSLSDDIAFRFARHDWSEWPLTSEKYIGWLKQLSPDDQTVTLAMDYATFGEHHKKETGIFDFLQYLLENLVQENNFKLCPPQSALKTGKKEEKLQVPNAISWSGIQKNLSAWENNELQIEAIERVYALKNDLKLINDKELSRNWEYLKSADHFLYMDEKNGGNPYENAYDAFLKYMNVLSDLELKVKNKVKAKSATVEKKHRKKHGRRQKIEST